MTAPQPAHHAAPPTQPPTQPQHPPAQPPTAVLPPTRTPARARWLAPLVAVTAVNYLWQVPYAVHQYGWSWTALPGLSLALLATGAWFAVAAHRYATGRRGGRGLLAGYLTVEVLFYLAHNASGALLADLPASNPVLLVASVLGYVNLLAAAWYLWRLTRPGTP